MAKIIKFPIAAQQHLGAKKVRRRKSQKLEEQGQLNIFDQAKTISMPGEDDLFERALQFDESNDDRAVEAYIRAIEKDQSKDDAYCNLGIILSQKEQPAKAIDYLTKSLKENPRHFEAHYNLANVYFDQGSFDLAKIHFEVAIEIDPDFPNSHYNQGLVYISLKKYAEAISSINNYIDLIPDSDQQEANKLLKTLYSIAQ